MLLRKIPNIPPELLVPLKDDKIDIESEAFQKRWTVLEKFAKNIIHLVKEHGSETDTSRMILSHIENPVADTADNDDLICGFVSLIYGGYLLQHGYEDHEHETALDMAEVYYNAVGADGKTGLERASEKTVGMDIYTASFVIAEDLIDMVNSHVANIPPGAIVTAPTSRTLN